MDRRSLYEDDIYAWAQQQAATLRRLAETRRDLPNELDLENVAEEIEDVGSNRRDAAESFIRLIFVHLIKIDAAPEASSVKHWRAEIVSFHINLLNKLTQSMHPLIDLDRLWERAIREAWARLEAEGEFDDRRLLWSKLRGCPLDIGLLSADDFDVDAALERLQNTHKEQP